MMIEELNHMLKIRALSQKLRDDEVVRFSLYKRHRTKGVYYYVHFGNPEKKNYDAG